MPPDLTVVVPTHRRPKLLRRTLASLAACEKPAGYRETVVVENGARGRAKSITRDYAEALSARWLFVRQGNKSRALNEALATLEGGLVVFFDDDVRLDSHVLTRYAEIAEGVSGGEMYGGPFEVDYEEAPPAWLKPYLPNSARGKSAEDTWHLSESSFDGFLGFNWAAFVEDIRSSGGFDEHFGPGSGALGQETIMQERLLRDGIRPRLAAGAKVWHFVPRERCSPAWLYGRQERAGRRNVRHLVRRGGAQARTVFIGMLVDRVARIAKRAPLAWWHQMSGSSEEQRFRQQYYLRYHLGALRELWRHFTSGSGA